MKAINYMTASIQLNLSELIGDASMTDVTLFCYSVDVLDQKVNREERALISMAE